MTEIPEVVIDKTRQTSHGNYRYGSFSFASAEEDPYFVSHKAPEGLELVKKKADEFIRFQCSKGRSVVLVTSGGSTVPLEVTCFSCVMQGC
jgi:hypothetical protein